MSDPYLPQDAWQDIADAQRFISRMRHRGLSYVFWWWGGVWCLAFATLAWFGDHLWVRFLWAGLGILGIIGTRILYARYGWRIRPQGGELHPGLFWTVMSAFIASVLWVTRPASLHTIGASVVIMIMWVYMVQGLLFRRPMFILLAASVTLATLLGHTLLSPRGFAWWMVVVMGISLGIGGWYRHRRQP